MKHKGLGFVLGISLLVGAGTVGEASAKKSVSKDVANSIKTVHERELLSRTIVSFEIWNNRKTANKRKTVYENELSDRTVIADENEAEEVTE
ncbi:hypothetical protein [Ureibacillus acetophenoni]|uniref:Uncharacterized protein n=1 Tax=Ureibacillus acetophenoni TaxID=614649 RepID=A0A285UH28_9BACL|nr:hypothetical protein [Ureibacillus acetophenoni]SOC40977.1 hypothetical protein SAMN05877842_10949 [Ureibacillus acetophenoni]